MRTYIYASKLFFIINRADSVNILNFIILVDTKAKMSLKAEAAKLYLSFLWWLLEPILFVAIFYFVFSVLLGTREPDFLLFLLCAKVPYMWFSKAIMNASGSITGNRGIISQIDIPKAIFPYSAIQVTIYKEIPVFILLFVTCLYFGYMPSTSWLWMIPLVITLYLMIVAIGLLTAIMVCYVEDVRMLISMGMTFLMFISGVFFDIRNIREPIQSYLLAFNPMAFFCDSFRTILMNRGIFDENHLFKLGVIFIVMILLLHWFYRRMSRTIAARVVNA
jgi:lipopolysaccharide transport system permease protein